MEQTMTRGSMENNMFCIMDEWLNRTDKNFSPWTIWMVERGGVVVVRFNNGKCRAYYYYYLILFLQTQ